MVKSMEKELPRLTNSEKIIVKLMYHMPAHSISLSAQEGITASLLQKKIVVCASSVGDNVGVFTFQFILQPWVVKYLDSHPDFFHMTEEQIKTQLKDHYNRIGLFN